MSTIDEVAELQARIKASGFKVSEVLREAGVDASTWTRWKSGATTPRLDNWRAIEKAIEKLTPSPSQSEDAA